MMKTKKITDNGVEEEARICKFPFNSKGDARTEALIRETMNWPHKFHRNLG